MRKIMIALLLVSSHRKDMSDREGNSESMTLGIVSPIITQKATMPPKALYAVNTCASRYHRADVQEPLRALLECICISALASRCLLFDSGDEASMSCSVSSSSVSSCSVSADTGMIPCA